MHIEQVADDDVTALLHELTNGKQEVAERIVPLVYQELKRLARGYMRRERPDHTLQTTALVHEAYLRLVKQRSTNWKGRIHFFAIAAQLMRRILIDHARNRQRGKRVGSYQRVPLDDGLVLSPDRSEEILKIDQVLTRLSQLDARQARIVELRFFGGLTVEETAEVLQISPKTVKRDWSVAKAWLHAEMKTTDENITGQVESS